MKAIADLEISPYMRHALDAIVQCIVETAKPQAVILFGSHAEGRGTIHSDFDFIVIADVQDTSRLEEELYMVTARLARGKAKEFPPCDILVLKPDEWEYEAQLPGLVYFRARRHGVVVYGQTS